MCFVVVDKTRCADPFLYACPVGEGQDPSHGCKCGPRHDNLGTCKMVVIR